MTSARRRIAFGSLVTAVAISGFGVRAITAPVAAAPVAAEPGDAGSAPLTRPDSISAMVTAQASGERVEDLSQGDEATRVFANPDGSWTSDTTPGPQRVRDEVGEWEEVDTTLVKVGGRLVPTASAVEMSLSAGGDKVFADAVPVGGVAKDELAWRWPTELPEPVLDGSTATYEDAVPGGGDLVVTATPTGFTHNIVLHEVPAALAEPEATAGDAPVFEVPMVTPGAKLEAAADGSLEVVDTKGAGSGDQVAAAPTPLMWDSSEDPESGDPVVETVDVSVENSTAANGTPIGTIELAPSVEFLTDPATVYPVTIDPTFQLLAQVDTWVSTAYPSSQSGSTELRAGTPDAGANKARSYMKFDGDSTWDGTQILKAELILRNWYSLSCASGAIRVQRLLESWNSNTISWSTQPEASNFYSDDYSPAHGAGSSCSASEATWNVKDMVQAWADNALANNGLRLRAVDESDTDTYRKYRSLEHGIDRPRIVTTYNRNPGTPSGLTAIPMTTYAPPSGTAANYTSTRTPKVSARVADPDTGKVQPVIRAFSTTSTSSTDLGTCTAPLVADNTASSCSLPALPENTTVYLRAKAKDQHGRYSGGSLSAAAGWTNPVELRVAATTPAAPAISCPAPYTDGSWSTTAPTTDVECTITAAGSGHSAPGNIRWSLNGVFQNEVKITPSADPNTAKITVTVPKAEGGYSIGARAVGRGGLYSPEATHGFGYGPFAITSPAERPDAKPGLTVTDRVAITAQGPANSSTDPEPVVKWRIAGSGEDETSTEWIEADLVDFDVDAPSGEKTTVAATVDTTGFEGIDDKKPVLLEFQLCLPYPSGMVCTWAPTPTTVLKVPHAFGGNYPVAGAGPGDVALWTGEFSLAETDVEEPGFNTSLSISRTHTTYGGLDGVGTGGAGIFGPGWTASIDGPGTGLTGATLLDSTRTDGALVLFDPTGGVLAWAKNTPVARRSGANLATGDWIALDEDTKLSGLNLSVAGTGSATTVTITDADGTKTIFKAAALPAGTDPYVLAPDAVEEAGQVGTTTFKADAQGRVTRILSPVPAGVTCASSGTLAAGCHALTLTYGTSGNANNRLTKVDAVHGPNSTPVASYDYDSDGRLVGVTDERTGLATTYSYDGTSARIASVTPAGLKAFNFAYDSDDKITTVTRDNPTGSGTTTLAQIRYNVPTDGTNGTPAIDAEAVGVWDQTTTPTYAAAVFIQGAPGVDANPANITSGEWKHAGFSYTDEQGRTLNTTEYGAGRWLIDATDYDELDNPIRVLDNGDIAAITDGTLAPSDAGTLTTYGQVKNSADVVTIPAGTVPTETFGPARLAAINTGGDVAWVRPHTKITYDENAPNNGIKDPAATDAPVKGYALATTSITRPWDVATGADLTGTGHSIAESRTGYDAIVAGDKSGWDLAAPTTTTTVMGGGQPDIVATTRYDDKGRVIETRQPLSNGADAGTRRSIYYTAGTNTADGLCGDKPAWAGLPCVTKYAGGDLPVERVTDYNDKQQPLTVTETVAGTLRRTTTNTYDTAGRQIKAWTKTHGMSASVATTGTKTTYDLDTGLPTTTQAIDNTGAEISGETITTGYDTWGREVSYEPAAGETTTTTYTAAGDVATVTDPRGTTTYTYDGTDADGNTEHRGLTTKISISRPGTSAVEFTGAYDADGTLVTHKLPGGLTQRTTTNTAGELTDMTYTGRVNLLDDNGDPVPTDDIAWVGWSQQSDIFGRTVHEWTPEGAAFTGDLNTGAGSGYSRSYAYDRAGRLTDVIDRTAPTGGGLIENGDTGLTTPAGTTCETRSYAFDRNGNRTSLTKKGANPDGTCNITVTNSRTWNWDNADRPTGTGYSIDPLGRITTLPAVDTPTGAAPITLGYYDDDTVNTITQDGTTSTYALDPVGRRAIETTGTTSVDMHYTGDGDNPAWSQTTITGTGGSTKTTRYLDNLSGDLSAVLVSNGTSTSESADLEIALANPHGDVITTVPIPTSGPATGIDAWSGYDEYGNPSTATTAPQTQLSDTGIGYGWVGAKQRATNPHGLILMGARPYNPTTGQFTSRDPIHGGNTTTYAYPQDPVNESDLTGTLKIKCGWCKKVKNAAKKVASTVGKYSGKISSVTAYCPLAQCQAVTVGLGLLSSASYAASGNRKKALGALKNTAMNVALGGRGKVSSLVRGKGKIATKVRATAVRRLDGNRGGAIGIANRRSRMLGATLWWGANVTYRMPYQRHDR